MKKPKAKPLVRWVLMGDFDWGPSPLGKYCWNPATIGNPSLFMTRREAVEARNSLNAYKYESRIVRCEVEIREVPKKVRTKCSKK